MGFSVGIFEKKLAGRLVRLSRAAYIYIYIRLTDPLRIAFSPCNQESEHVFDGAGDQS